MATIIQDKDVKRFVSLAMNLIQESCYSPIEIIKQIRVKEACSLAEAKEAYTLANSNETLGEYQERVILPLINELEEFEKNQNHSIEKENTKT